MNKHLTITDGTGVTSCLSVRLSDCCEYARKYGFWPATIDASNQFWWYRNDGDGDLNPILMSEYIKPDDMIISSFHHNWQFNWYDDIDLYMNSALAKLVCPVSFGVEKRSDAIRPFIENRMAVVYRSNDKAKEIPETPYEAVAEMARDCAESKFFLQTDDENFLQFFIMQFPDTLYLNTLPRIEKNLDRYVMPITGKKDFAFEFISVINALKFASGLITTTGNIGLWSVLMRGNVDNTYQYHGREQRWRKLG